MFMVSPWRDLFSLAALELPLDTDSMAVYEIRERGGIMYFTIERIRRIVRELKGYTYTESQPINVYDMKPCGYGEFDALKDDSHWTKFNSGTNRWGGRDKHFWFKSSFTVPQSMEG